MALVRAPGPGDAVARLWANVMVGLPGAFERYEPDELRVVIAEQLALTHEELRRNLVRFLEAVIPAAEEAGVMMAIHHRQARPHRPRPLAAPAAQGRQPGRPG